MHNCFSSHLEAQSSSSGSVQLCLRRAFTRRATPFPRAWAPRAVPGPPRKSSRLVIRSRRHRSRLWRRGFIKGVPKITQKAQSTGTMTNIGPAAYHLHQQQAHLAHGYGSPAPGLSFPPSFPQQQYSQSQHVAQRQQAPVPHNYQQFQQQNFAYGHFQPQSNAPVGPSTSSSKFQHVEDPIPERVTLAGIGLHFLACHTCQNRRLTDLGIKLRKQCILQPRTVSRSLLRTRQCQCPKLDRHPIQVLVPSRLRVWQHLANHPSRIL